MFKLGGAVIPSDAPPGWQHDDPPYWTPEPRIDLAPSGEFARAGKLLLCEGTFSYELTYNDRGVHQESLLTGGGDNYWTARHFSARSFAWDPHLRPPGQPPISLLLRPDLLDEGMTVEAFAAMVVELDDRGRDGLRVHLPLPVPGGPEGVVSRGLRGALKALLGGRVPEGPGFLVVDGFDGTAIGWGATPEDARSAWEADVERVRPKPPGWGKAPEAPDRQAEADRLRALAADPGPRELRDEGGTVRGISTGMITVSGGPGSTTPWPMPVPRHVPALLLWVEGTPTEMPGPLARAGFDRFHRAIDEHGTTQIAAVRRESDGFTLVGEGVFDLIDDFDAIDAGIDEAIREDVEWMRTLPEGSPRSIWDRDDVMPGRTGGFTLWDGPRRRRLEKPQMAQGSASAQGLRWVVTRLRGPGSFDE